MWYNRTMQELRSNLSYETAQAYFLNAHRWRVQEGTFILLSADLFVCLVSTTNRVERGEAKETLFWVLYNRASNKLMTLSLEEMQALRLI